MKLKKKNLWKFGKIFVSENLKKNGHPFTTVVHRRSDKFLPSKMANLRLSHGTEFTRGGNLYKFPKDHEMHMYVGDIQVGPCLTCGLTFAMVS